MQQLEKRNTYISRNISQVSGSMVMSLNKEETLSEHNLKTFSNNPDVNQRSGKSGQDLRVPVINMRGESLMPTTPAKARHLLKQGKAKVIRCNPFVIQLNYATGEATQPITLGVDAGYSHIGFSAIFNKKELFSGEVTLRKDVSKKLSKRQMYRRNKRNRLWYREPRFLNRISSKKKGWLAPSIQHRLDSHIRLVEKIKSLLPISKIIIEVASFDTQKMQNPEISGIEYQQGELQGYNVREYLLDKWGRKCAYCNKKDIPLEIEHIIPKSRGGTNRVSNLTLSCNRCNLKKGNKTAKEFGYPDIQKKAKLSLKATAFMNSIRWKLVNQLNCDHTYGYITKCNRIKLGLKKSHSNDAFVIAGGNGQLRSIQYNVKQIRRNNRCLQLNRKGFKPAIRRQRYKLQPNDLVRWNNQILGIKGVHCKGERVILSNKKSVKVGSVELYKYMRGWQFFLAMNDGVSLPKLDEEKEKIKNVQKKYKGR